MTGLTTAGLEIKRLADITADMRAALEAEFGPDVQTGPDSVLGVLIGVFAQQLSQVWELAQQLYDSVDPDTAEGAALDAICSLVGIRRLGELRSSGVVTLTGTALATIPAGTIFESSSTLDRFRTIADVVLGAGGTVDATVEGVDFGDLRAPAGTLTDIVTPVSGLDSLTNAEDITPGRLAESDAVLRGRREESLQVTGAGVDIAIRAALAAISGVAAARVVSNRTDAIVDGIPAHAFESVVYPDPSDEAFNTEVVETIFRLQPAGIKAHGDLVYSVTDAEGFAQEVGFSFATELEVYITATVVAGAEYPADGDDQVQAAMLAEGALLSVGDDVKVWKLIASCDHIPGIVDLDIAIGLAPSPVGTANLPVGNLEVADFDSSRTVVNS